mmetsp:Transcript_46858/g.86981  ORF Transcript_46858/g.86981 Transcript_46858/m.86981 type:complete len:117 (-) Transcript_46858:1022-1372(-)
MQLEDDGGNKKAPNEYLLTKGVKAKWTVGFNCQMPARIDLTDLGGKGAFIAVGVGVCVGQAPYRFWTPILDPATHAQTGEFERCTLTHNGRRSPAREGRGPFLFSSNTKVSTAEAR